LKIFQQKHEEVVFSLMRTRDSVKAVWINPAGKNCEKNLEFDE